MSLPDILGPIYQAGKCSLKSRMCGTSRKAAGQWFRKVRKYVSQGTLSPATIHKAGIVMLNPKPPGWDNVEKLLGIV